MRLETRRLRLIRLTAPQMGQLIADLPEFEKAMGVRYIGSPETDGMAEIVEGMLISILQFPAARHWRGVWVFVDQKEKAIIGSACFRGEPDENGTVEIGYEIHAKEWRSQGYATEGVLALTHWALAQPGVGSVSARCDKANPASARVLQKCGFLLNGGADSLPRWNAKLFAPFVCPICGNPFLRAEKSLFCRAGHAFDFSRQGYVNLLKGKPETIYEDKALFEARRAVYVAGFFDAVVDAVRGRVPSGSVLDVGCGEGSLIHRLQDKVACRVGLDIAKSAVKMAAAVDHGALWCVGDLCNLPLPNRSVDAILNILTPANYTEFYRVLRPEGLLIKIIPGEGHLAEIRAILGKVPYREKRLETLRALGERFEIIEELPIRYTFFCDETLAAQVYAMTPLTTHGPRARIPAGDITVDLALVVGYKNA